MRKKKILKILEDVRRLKKEMGFEIIDCHVHPLDVMGVVHYSEVANECKHEDYLKPGLLEFFNYSKIEKLGSRLYFKLFPKSIFSMIASTYRQVNQERILEEMNASLADKSVLLSLEPWVPTISVGDTFSKNKQFYTLGSVDVHSIDITAIESTIKSYIDKYGIVGLKLHPNLQGFLPQPSQNEPEVAEKLKKLYETAEKYNLYLLFHGGISNYTEDINPKYNFKLRSKTNAVLENFCDNEGKSELLGKYAMPIIIAHIGHYGIVNVNYGLVKKVSETYQNVFFDTSGVSPEVITKALRIIPSTKLIFGSDALYNRIAYNVGYLYLAARRCNNGEKYESILENVFSKNFKERILKK